MKKLYIVLCCLSLSSFAIEICELETRNHKLALDLKEKGCEFPEGLVKDCIRIIHTNKKSKIKNLGDIIFRKDISFESFCEISKKTNYKGHVVRGTLSSEIKNIEAYLMCPTKKQRADLIFKIRNSTKKCSVIFK